MEERQTPPLAEAVSSPNTGAQTPILADMKWPPQGWPMFSCVTQTSGTAFRTGQNRGQDDFVKYEIIAREKGIYEIEILRGRIGPGGVSLKPAMGLRFAAREDIFDDNSNQAVLDIHVGGQRLIPERGCILRVILAMTFIISRIDRGTAPSIKRVLKTYQLI